MSEPTPVLRRSKSTLERFRSDVDMNQWTLPRRTVASVISSQLFEAVLALMVLLSLGIMIIETDMEAGGEPSPGWVELLETILLLVYCVEMAARAYVFRMQLFHSPLHVMDFLVVLTDTISFIITQFAPQIDVQVSFFRALRLVRLTRAFHVLRSQDQLSLMVDGLLASLKTTLFGLVFIIFALVIFAILAVKFLNPLQVEFCSSCSQGPRAFISVYTSMCTLFDTMIIGEGWGDVFLPYVTAYPETLPFIVTPFVVIHLALLDLICAVIVDVAIQAREENTREAEKEKLARAHIYQKRLQQICADIDTDQSGELSLSELLGGFKSSPEFRRILSSLDLDQEDMKALFSIMDEDSSGAVEYIEFVEQLHKMKTNNTNTMLMFIKHYLIEVQRSVAEELNLVRTTIVGGMSEMKEKVNEQHALIQNNAATSMKAFESLSKHIDAAPQKVSEDKTEGIEKQQPHTDHMALHSQDTTVLTPLVAKLPAMSGQSLPADSQLQLVTEQIGTALEDLRCKCETSAMLLASFRGLFLCLPNPFEGTDVDRASSLEFSSDSHESAQSMPRISENVGMPSSGAADKIVEASSCLVGTDCSSLDASDGPGCRNFLLDRSSLQQWTEMKDSLPQDAMASNSQECLRTDFVEVFEFTDEDTGPKLGMDIHWAQDALPYVGKVMPDSPANVRGVLPGDRLAECNNVSVVGMDRKSVLQLLSLRPLHLKMYRTDQ